MSAIQTQNLTFYVDTDSIYIMKRNIKKWGNSLAVRIPKEIIEKYQLSENTEVQFLETEQRLVLKPLPKKKGNFRDIWQDYVLPWPKGKKKERDLSLRVDEILYGKKPD